MTSLHRLHRWAAVILAGAALSAASGCGGGPSGPAASTSTTPAKVSGKVTIGGKPADAGEIVFDPTNINRKDVPASKAPIGKDGSYSTSTLVGENSIYYQGPGAEDNRERSMYRKTVEIKSGDNPIDVDIP